MDATALGINLQAMDTRDLRIHGSWLFRAGRQEGYDAACRLLAGRERLSDFDDLQLARLASLSPQPPVPPSECLRIGAASARAASYRNAYGMCLLRSDRVEDALVQFRLAAEHRWAPELDWLAAAIAHHQAGRAEIAKIWLEMARARCDEFTTEIESGYFPSDRILGEILLREAETLIEPDQAAFNAPYAFPEVDPETASLP